MIPTRETVMSRAIFTLIGGGAGLCLYVLAVRLPDIIQSERALLFVLSFGLGYLGVLLGLMGPVRLGKAAIAALAMALPASLLLLWASFRHETIDGVLGGGYALAAFVYLLAISVPFAIARLQQHGGWRHYGLLFDGAWDLVVRIASAGLFTGVVWSVILMSDQLLGLVGLTVIGDLIEFEPVPYLISGMAIGLSLGIVHELRDYVSPFLIIQLLRVLLPALLVVLGVFILALPFRGLSELFGQLSAAATLLCVTVVGITLITTAIHRDDSLSVRGSVMLTAARVLSVMLVVPALLSLWAVGLRVGQYGLTPDRVAALVAAAVACVYALAYAGALLRRASWRTVQRNVNRRMAVVTLCVAAAWLTPIINAERMAAQSQLARAAAGAEPDDLPLWELAHEWGKPGKRALAQLEEASSDRPDLLARIGRARRSDSEWSFDDGDLDLALDGQVPLRPEGHVLPEDALGSLPENERRMIAESCARRAPGGHPGCVIVFGAFEGGSDAMQGIGFFMTPGGGVYMRSFSVMDDILVQGGAPDALGGEAPAQIGAGVISDIMEGRFDIVPVERRVLEVGGARLVPDR